MKKFIPNTEELNKILKMYNEELLGSQTISEKMGLSKPTILRILKENGIVMGPSGRRFIGGKKVADKKWRDSNLPLKSKIKLTDNEKLEIKRKKSREYNKSEIGRIKRSIRRSERWKNDTNYKLSIIIRRMIRNSIGSKKSKNSQEIIGCSFEEFKTYLESKFESWMSWKNYGLYNGELNYGWDIDHIIPISSARLYEDIVQLNHYTNLQPLCSRMNRDIKKNFVSVVSQQHST